MNILDKIAIKKATLADQEEALQDPWCAYMFALHVVNADIKRCQNAALKDPFYAYFFVKHIPGTDVVKSIEACKGTEWEHRLNEYLMSKALM